MDNLMLQLPQELWLHIFRLATSNAQYYDAELDYAAFQAIPISDITDTIQASLDVKRTLLLVCKAWRAIALEIVYEVVRISHGTARLRIELDRSRDDAVLARGQVGDPPSESTAQVPSTYGHWVKRIEIGPIIFDFDPLNPDQIPELLKRCPRVETIVRTHVPVYRPRPNLPLSRVRNTEGNSFPSLPSLKRIDWAFAGYGPCPRNGLYGRFGLLHDLLRASPNLRYLSFSNPDPQIPWWSDRFDDPPLPTTLSSLNTLRWESSMPTTSLTGVFGTHWLVPNLTNLVTHPFASELHIGILQPLGAQLQVVEFLDSRDGTYAYSDVLLHQVLRLCPDLRELCIYVSKASPFRFRDATLSSNPHRSLECVRFCLGDPDPADAQSLAEHVRSHFQMLVVHSHVFPALRRVVFDGRSNEIQTSRFLRPLEEMLRAIGCTLEVVE